MCSICIYACYTSYIFPINRLAFILIITSTSYLISILYLNIYAIGNKPKNWSVSKSEGEDAMVEEK